jgi:hypothetical protein
MCQLCRFALAFVWLLVAVGCQAASPAPTDPPLPTLVPTVMPTAELTVTPPIRSEQIEAPDSSLSSDRSPRTTAIDPHNQAHLRLVHALADGPEIDIFMENLAIASNLRYGRSSQPTGIAAGEYHVRVFPAGLRGSDRQPLLEQEVRIDGGQTLALIFAGSADDPTLTAYPEYTATLDRNESRISVIHAIRDGPAFTLRHDNANLTLPVEYGQQTIPVTVSSGPTTFSLHSGDQIVANHVSELRERGSYTLVAAGHADDPESITLVEFFSHVPGNATVRVIHAAAELGPLDVYLGPHLVAEQLEYPRTTEREPLASENYQTMIYPAGSDPASTSPLARNQFSVYPEDDITVLIMGTADNPSIVRHRDNLAPTSPSGTRIAFANVISQLPATVYRNGERIAGMPILAYRQISSPTEQTAGPYRLSWTITGSAGELTAEITDELHLDAGQSYLFLLTGRAPQQPPLIFSENVGTDSRLADIPIGEPTPTPGAPVRARFINAIADGTAIDYFLDDIQTAAALGYGQTTEPIIITAGMREIHVRPEGQEFNMRSVGYDFSGGEQYSIFAHGSATSQADLLIVREPEISTVPDLAYVRLVNLSRTPHLQLGLGYTDPSPQAAVDSEIAGTPEITEFEYRRPLSGGIPQPIRQIPPGTTSIPIGIPPGAKDLYIIDNNVTLLAELLRNVTLEPGTHYDIIAFEDGGTPRIIAYIMRSSP